MSESLFENLAHSPRWVWEVQSHLRHDAYRRAEHQMHSSFHTGSNHPAWNMSGLAQSVKSDTHGCLLSDPGNAGHGE